MNASLKYAAGAVALVFCARKMFIWHPFVWSKFIGWEKVSWDNRVTRHAFDIDSETDDGIVIYSLFDDAQKCHAQHARVGNITWHRETCKGNGSLKPSLKELVEMHVRDKNKFKK